MNLDFNKFKQEAIKLCILYHNIKIRGGTKNPCNFELVQDAIDILSYWEKILLLTKIDTLALTPENIKIISVINSQMNVLKVLKENFNFTEE